MNSLFNSARSRFLPQLLKLPQRQFKTKYCFTCPKYNDPCQYKDRCSARAETLDPCNPKQRQCVFKSMWEPKRHPCLGNDKQNNCEIKMMLNDKCCFDPCEQAYPRFDSLYYKESDKCRRRYQRTWAECPMIKIVHNEVCCFDQLDHPDPETRCLKRCPPVCTATSCDLQKRLCSYGEQSSCPRIAVPCCPKARIPPKCKRENPPCQCTKVCTQYPSYSECQKCKPKPLRPVECKCWEIPPCSRASSIKWG